MWRLKIKQYFQVQDYALWDVIENGNSFRPVAQTTTNVDGTSTSLIPGLVTTEEKVQKKNDVKARSMLLMALPNEHIHMHNNIMAAGSRDRPPMLTTGGYAQWRSRFLRYIDTRPNGDALRKCILKGPYTPIIVTTPVVLATEDSLAVPEQTTVETITNMTLKNRAHFELEKEAIHLILTGIGDKIYSTVDACQTAQEMWEAIERLQQGESLNIQDVKTSLFWKFGQFTSHDGETIESYYTRIYKMMNEMIRNNLTVATMQVNV
ncbi:hypothetical protein Tco_1052383 [Tanacetum coccineum]